MVVVVSAAGRTSVAVDGRRVVLAVHRQHHLPPYSGTGRRHRHLVIPFAITRYENSQIEGYLDFFPLYFTEPPQNR